MVTAATYEELLSLVSDKFKLARECVKIYYTDEEGDEVSVSN